LFGYFALHTLHSNLKLQSHFRVERLLALKLAGNYRSALFAAFVVASKHNYASCISKNACKPCKTSKNNTARGLGGNEPLSFHQHALV
jgi:hypothetical protein